MSLSTRLIFTILKKTIPLRHGNRSNETIDQDLMDAANIIANEKVQIVNNNNGARLETYVIPGQRGSGIICLNGAAARLVQVGDIVIIISYATMDFEEAKQFQPAVVFPDDNNHLIR